MQKESNKLKSDRGPIAECIVTSLMMLVYTVVFSLAGVVFLIDVIPSWIRIAVGILFLLPICALALQAGIDSSIKDYAKGNNGLYADIHDRRATRVNPFVPILRVLPYILFQMGGILIAVLCSVQWLQAIFLIVNMPSTLVFMSVGVISITAGVTYFAVLVVGVVVLLVVGLYVGGYIFTYIKKSRQTAEIVTEIRNYD